MDGDKPHHRPGPRGWEPVTNLGGGAGPCCASPRWPDCLECPHYATPDSVEMRMEEERPDIRANEAPPLYVLGERDAVLACQAEAFRAGDEDWYRYGEGSVRYRCTDDGEWEPDPASLEAEAPETRA